MDSNKYNEAFLQQLTDNEYHEEIEHDSNTEYRQIIDSTIDKMSASELITDLESTKTKQGTCTPRFYGLPKLHKQYSDFPPLRPICSGYNSCTVRISEFVDTYLKLIAQQSLSYVKVTTAFLNKPCNFTISPNTIANHFLVTMDVTSLYLNIDHEEGTEACYDRLRRHKIPSLLCNFLRRLIYLVLKCNTLRFGSRFFHQIKVTAMGTSMAVDFASIFMFKFEEEMLDEFHSIHGLRPAIWLRFIDHLQFTPCSLASFYRPFTVYALPFGFVLSTFYGLRVYALLFGFVLSTIYGLRPALRLRFIDHLLFTPCPLASFYRQHFFHLGQ